MSKFHLGELRRPELLELQQEIKERLKTFRPYRIKERVTQCGKKECWCFDGPDGHGPYLSVVYRADGKTVSEGIGPKLTELEMKKGYPDLPDLRDYLTVPDYKYALMTRAETEAWLYYTMTPRQFIERHGIPKSEDTFDRPEKYWGSKDAHVRYESDRAIAIEKRNIPYNQWAGYGVSTLRGIAVLEQLERDGYYLKVG